MLETDTKQESITVFSSKQKLRAESLVVFRSQNVKLG